MKKILLLFVLVFLVGCDDGTTYNYVTCQFACGQRGYESGVCVRNDNSLETDLSIGGCVAPQSINCQNINMCSCFCGDDLTDSGRQGEGSGSIDLVVEPRNFDSPEIDILFEEMKSETRMNFSDEVLVLFDWMKDGEVGKLFGKQTKAWNLPVNGEMLLNLFFDQHGFEIVVENVIEGTYKNQLGWQKDNIVCVLNTEIFVEAGEPSGDNLYQVTCGIK